MQHNYTKLTALVILVALVSLMATPSVFAAAASMAAVKQSCNASLLLEYHIFFLAQASHPLKQPRPTRLILLIDHNCGMLPLSLDDLLNYTTLMLKFCINKLIWALPFLSLRVRTGTKVKSMPVDWPSCQHM
jgi:hypothetical protein